MQQRRLYYKAIDDNVYKSHSCALQGMRIPGFTASSSIYSFNTYFTKGDRKKDHQKVLGQVGIISGPGVRTGLRIGYDPCVINCMHNSGATYADCYTLCHSLTNLPESLATS
jgi:hypothetical protein